MWKTNKKIDKKQKIKRDKMIESMIYRERNNTLDNQISILITQRIQKQITP